MRASYEIALRGMQFHLRIGVLPHERELPQPVEIDLIAWPVISKSATHEGALVDYRAVYDLVASVVREGPIDYLEGLVSGIAARVLERFDVERVRVAARKPHVTLPGPLKCAEVAVDISRDG